MGCVHWMVGVRADGSIQRMDPGTKIDDDIVAFRCMYCGDGAPRHAPERPAKKPWWRRWL